MIIPGLLTASTNKADHLGMSTDRVACLSMIDAPFAAWFGLVSAGFPLRSDVRTRVGAQPTQALPERSGGLGGFAESWRLGSRGRMRAKKGETNSSFFSAEMERSGIKTRPIHVNLKLLRLGFAFHRFDFQLNVYS